MIKRIGTSWHSPSSSRSWLVAPIHADFSKPSGTGNYGWRCPYGVEHSERWSPVSATWAAHEANHEVPWQDQDSRGVQASLNSGATWDWHDEGALIRSRGPILYRCVV